MILLNKVDLATPEQLDAAEASLKYDLRRSTSCVSPDLPSLWPRRQINSTALVHRTTRSTLDLNLILDLNMFASSTAPVTAASLAPFATSSTTSPCCDSPTHEGHNHPSPSTASPHANDITSVTIPLPLLPSEEALREGPLAGLIKELIWEGQLPGPNPPTLDLLRTKGFFLVQAPGVVGQLAAPARAFILQGVRDTFEITEMPLGVEKGVEGAEGKEMQPKLVLIGRGLGDGTEARRRFAEALREQEESSTTCT